MLLHVCLKFSVHSHILMCLSQNLYQRFVLTPPPLPRERAHAIYHNYDVTTTRQHAGIDYVPHGRFARLRKTKPMKDMTVIVRIRFRIFGLKITNFVMQFHFFLFFLFFTAAGMLYNCYRSCTLPKKNGRPREQVYMRTGVYENRCI